MQYLNFHLPPALYILSPPTVILVVLIIIIIRHFISLEPAFWATLPLYSTKTLFQLPPTTILYMPCDVMMSIATTLRYYASQIVRY